MFTSSLVRRYQIPVFFTLAYALSWLVWGTNIARQRGLLSFHFPGAFAYFSVSGATFIIAGSAAGWAGVKDLVLRRSGLRQRVQLSIIRRVPP